MEICRITQYEEGFYEATLDLLRELDPDKSPMLTKEELKMIISSPNTHLFFAMQGGEIAGMLTVACYLTPSGHKAWIEDVAVASAYRGEGIGKKLVKYALGVVSSLEISSVMLTSRPSRVAANKLYTSLEFEKRQTNVYKFDINNLK